jgi:cytochrome b involved in lipid metabolism
MVKIIKILRTTAWMLIFAMAITLLSGFVAAKPFFAPFFGGLNAYYFHVVVVPLFFIPLVYVHSLMGILLFFARNQKYNIALLKSIACGLWTALFILFGFMYFAQAPSPKISDIPNTSVLAEVTLNTTEIAKHNVESDCWMVINNKVYNLSGYATAHPGGTSNITSYCGKEATTAFGTKGGQGNSHSGGANDLLASYYIGALNASVAPSAVVNTSPPAQTSTDNEYEDD